MHINNLCTVKLFDIVFNFKSIRLNPKFALGILTRNLHVEIKDYGFANAKFGLKIPYNLLNRLGVKLNEVLHQKSARQITAHFLNGLDPAL
jgi:hypothetical protein